MRVVLNDVSWCVNDGIFVALKQDFIEREVLDRRSSGLECLNAEAAYYCTRIVWRRQCWGLFVNETKCFT